MANTLTDLVTSLRGALLDTAIPYLWTDAALQQIMTEAVTEHSYLYPRLVYTLYDVASNQQDFTLAPVGPGGSSTNPPPTTSAEMIGVVGVECPPGAPIPEDPWESTDPPPSASSRAAQGYRWRWLSLRLRVPATGSQVGNAHLVVALAQTWNLPDNSNGWNGPSSDVSLLLLLARRAAYQLLAEWQAREQGVKASTTMQPNASARIDVKPILDAIEAQITRALATRAARNGTFPVLRSSP